MIIRRLSSVHPLYMVACIVGGSILIELSNAYPVNSLQGFFEFHREGIANGQFWRLLTGHLDHLGWEHLALNVIFFVLVASLFERFYSAMNIFYLWILSCILISALMLLFSPNLVWYVGLSGSLYSLLVLGLLGDRSYPIVLRGLILMALVIKVAVEQFDMSVSSVSDLIGGPVAVDAHMYGVFAGCALSFLVWLKSHLSEYNAV